jgi:uncharacterized protein involved in outer membrane biogenesis/outer membrane protein OmpA-like peptidoglycan-associated protein
MPMLTPKRKIVLWILVGIFALYTLAGFVAAPMVIRHILETKVSQALSRQVKVDTVRVNPYTLSVKLTGLSVSDKTAATLLSLDQLEANAQISSLFRRALVIKSVLLVGPHLNVVRTAADRFNFSDLLEPQPGTPPAPSTEPAKPLRVILGRLQLTGGNVQFEDRSLGAPFTTTLAPVELTVTAVDTAPDAPAGSFQGSLATEAQETIKLKGHLAPVPLVVDIDMDLRAIALAKYAPYYQPYWNAKLATGKLDLQAAAHWSAQEGNLENGTLTVSELEIDQLENPAPMLQMPNFQIQNARIDLQQHAVELGRISSQDATAWLRREADGQLNWLTALQATSSANTSPSPAPSSETGAATPSDPWVLTVPELAVANYRVELNDLQPAQPAKLTLDNLRLNAKNLGTRPDTQGEIDLSMAWGEKGTLAVAGTLGLLPTQADFKVSVDGLDIRPLQPYVNEYLGLVITSGRFGTQGELQLRLAPNASPEVRYAGKASLVDFKSVDAEQNADFFNFRSLFLNGLRMGIEPLDLSIEEVALTDFFNKVYIAADRTSNIAAIFKGKSEAAGDGGNTAGPKENQHQNKVEAEKKAPPASIQIKTVIVQGGNIDFNDLSINPAVHLPMQKVGGRISGLDAIAENKADVLLEGMVRGNEPLKITGKINPLISPPFLDVKLNLTSVDLSPFAPYAEKYLGYKLTKGLLSMNLAYLVQDNKLEGKNNAVLTQLTLGDSVPSEDATKLPIKLAIALLKDRQGNIDIDLPVRGDLDNPEFSIGSIVLKMVGNLILEIVTSPFKMLGALFGGSEKLSYIEFTAGSADLEPDNRAKLDNLAKILYERPGLNLDIQGQVNRDSDSEGLRISGFEHQLKSAKLKAMMAAGKPAIPLEQITISAEERDLMIRQAYAAATFPKPRDEKGKEKVLPPEEMEKMLYTAIEITDDDLRALASQRALATKSYLLETGKVEAQRLFTLEPVVDNTAEANQSRVRFSLK